MTRETWCVAVFYPGIFAGLYFDNIYSYFIAGFAAFGFLISQAQILYAAKGIPTWRAPLMPWMIGFSGLYEGLALLGLFAPIADMQLQSHLLLICGAGIILGLTNALIFALYSKKAKTCGIGPLSRRDINAMKLPVMGLGQILPVALLIYTLITPDIGLFPFFIASALTVLGGAYWKLIIITKACHVQSFEIPMMPQRGSGQRAAPERMGLNLSQLANKGVTR
jgi:phenylacetyl-CoA:acceptor oxidoreductase subunit 2